MIIIPFPGNSKYYVDVGMPGVEKREGDIFK